MRAPDAADHARLSAAVLSAEGATSGEIVTIVAASSDTYEDVALLWAGLTALLVPVLFAAWPALPLALVGQLTGGWGGAEVRDLMLLACAGIVIVAVGIFAGLQVVPLRHALTPHATRRRRVRRRAIALFRVAAEGRTSGRTGILIYLSLGERMAEIVADEAIHSAVADTQWGDAMIALIAGVRAGSIADGMIAAVERVGEILAAHLPRASDDRNELPDRLIEL